LLILIIIEHFFSPLSNSPQYKHSVSDCIAAFAEYFKRTYNTDGVGWMDIQPAVQDIREFLGECVFFFLLSLSNTTLKYALTIHLQIP